MHEATQELTPQKHISMEFHLHNSAFLLAQPLRQQTDAGVDNVAPIFVPPYVMKVHELDDDERERANQAMQLVEMAMRKRTSVDLWVQHIRNQDSLRWGAALEGHRGRGRGSTTNSSQGRRSRGLTKSSAIESSREKRSMGESVRSRRPTAGSVNTTQSVPVTTSYSRRPTLREAVTSMGLPLLETRETFGNAMGRSTPEPVASPVGNAFGAEGYWASTFSPPPSYTATPVTAVTIELAQPDITERPLTLVEDPLSRAAYEETRDSIRIYAQHICDTNGTHPSERETLPTTPVTPCTPATPFTPATTKITAVEELAAAEMVLTEKHAQFPEVYSTVNPSDLASRLRTLGLSDLDAVEQYSIKRMSVLLDDTRWVAADDAGTHIETILDKQREAVQEVRKRRAAKSFDLPAQAYPLVWATHFLEQKQQECLGPKDGDDEDDDEGYSYDNFLRSISREASMDAEDAQFEKGRGPSSKRDLGPSSKRHAPTIAELDTWADELKRMEQKEKERQGEIRRQKSQRVDRALAALQYVEARDDAEEEIGIAL